MRCVLTVDLVPKIGTKLECVKRKIDLPFVPVQAMRLKLATNLSDHDPRYERFADIKRRILNSRGFFQLQDVTFYEEQQLMELKTSVAERTEEDVDLAASYLCEFFGFYRFPPLSKSDLDTFLDR